VKRFAEFYSETGERLFAYLVRMSGDPELARDILQESFTRYLERYGREAPSAPLLYTIARNAYFDTIRKRRQTASVEPERDLPGPDPEGQLMVREDYRRMLEAFQQLSRSERETLSLVVSSGLGYRAVGEIVGTSEANVKVKVHRARLKLRAVLKED
jgi:RNA polymerase sigma-70 factor (ECF subfamily)